MNLTCEVFVFRLPLFSKSDMVLCTFLYSGCKGAKIFSYVPYKSKEKNQSLMLFFHALLPMLQERANHTCLSDSTLEPLYGEIDTV